MQEIAAPGEQLTLTDGISWFYAVLALVKSNATAITPDHAKDRERRSDVH